MEVGKKARRINPMLHNLFYSPNLIASVFSLSNTGIEGITL
jgi:hypothetical protein